MNPVGWNSGAEAPAVREGSPAPHRVAAEASELIGKGTLIMVGSTLAFFALNLGARVAAARVLSIQAWGEFNLGVSFTAFLSVVILLGLNNAVARFLVLERDPAVRRSVVRWALWVSAGLAVSASLATYFLASPLAGLFHEPALASVFELLAAAVGLGAVTPMLAAVFQGFHDMLPNALFNQVLNPVVFLAAVLLLLLLHWQLEGALIAYLLANVAAFVASVGYYLVRVHRHLPLTTPTQGRLPRDLWSSSVALWGIGSLAFVTAYADTLLLGAYRPAVDVGFYSTAMALARTLLLAGAALTFIFLPLAARLAREGEVGVLSWSYTVAARWILAVSIPLFLLFAILPGPSVVALFGPKYLPSASALQVLSITAFASSVIGPSNACLAGLGRDRPQLLATAVSGATNVALSFALIPSYGVLGAAIAWGVARALYPGVCLLVLYKDYDIHPFRPVFWRPMAVTLAVATPVFLAVRWLVHDTWVVYPLFFLGLGVFLGSLLMTRSIVPDDLIFIRAVERMFRVRLPRLRAIVTGRYAGPVVS
jgi:O-antigen/teichoic acid export membrane protein